MVAQDQHLAEVFKQPPFIAYKKQRNLKDILVISKISPPIERYPQRTLKGMAKCGKTCLACPYVKTGSEIKIDQLIKVICIIAILNMSENFNNLVTFIAIKIIMLETL